MKSKCPEIKRSTRARAVVLLLFALFGCRLARSQSERALPDDNLGYPVLITLADGSSGSGFFLETPATVYLVTARHVLFKPKPSKDGSDKQSEPWELASNEAIIRSYSRDPADLTANIFALDLSSLSKMGFLKHGQEKDKDVAIVHIADIPTAGPGKQMFPVAGVKAIEVAKQGILGVAIENVKRFDETLVGNDIFIFGYPSSLGLRDTPQIDYERPLLRKGIIAGKNSSARSLIIDCAVYPGNSGGPVVELDKSGFQTHFTVIGIVVQFIPFSQVTGNDTIALQVLSNSGYSVVLPIDDVLELI